LCGRIGAYEEKYHLYCINGNSYITDALVGDAVHQSSELESG